MKFASCKFDRGFRVLTGDARSQVASMVIEPGDSEGGPDNNHGDADQWLIVVDGTGEATINDRTYQLVPGSIVLIQRGDRHEICSAATGKLKTLNIYLPPAYTLDGEELPAGGPA